MRPILIVDFEATCWGSATDPPRRPDGREYVGEIIEFGCALLEAKGPPRLWQT